MNFTQAAVGLLVFTSVALAQITPEWIWHPESAAKPGDGETRFFRKSLTVTGSVSRATLSVTADNHFTAYVNGQKVGEGSDWSVFARYDVAKHLKAGENVIAIEARNDGGAAGLLAQLAIRGEEGGTSQTIVTDTSWRAGKTAPEGWRTASFQAETWVAARSLGKLGMQPWGNVAAAAGGRSSSSGGKPATPAESLQVLDGFKVELLRSAQAGEGSWVAMAVDPKGRLIISPQGKEPMLRVTLDRAGQITKLEKIEVPVTGAMGLLYAFDALYVNGQGPDGYHLYRISDSNDDDQLDKVELLRKWKGGPGEHGAHGIVLGTDEKLYIVNGNFVDVPGDVLPTSPHRNYADDVLLPRMEDGNGFGAGRQPPGGYVVRLDKDGKNAELFASGQRNTYDIAFNADGELFGFDSDMEWDWGAPWYRPTRAFHITSGADHGFREGSAKWPEFYEDSLPAVVNFGIGSPTGVLFPIKAKFPAKYREALLMMDWSYGRIVAVHLQPAGATYRGTFETLVKGKPLNVTDMEVGPDGALYFATGGRGTQSGLYRVSYTGETGGRVAKDDAAEKARELRRKIEAFHGKADAKAVATVWPHLKRGDRAIRYAARVALESQPVSEWKEKALAEKDANAGLTALMALARVGSKETQPELLGALKSFPMSSLTQEQQLLKLRVLELSLIRQGMPQAELAKLAVEKLSPLYPANSWPLNRELSQILIYLDAPGVVGRTLELVANAPTQEEQLHYVVALRKAKSWSLDERKRYFSWFVKRSAGEDAGPTYPAGGNYFINASTRHPAEFEQWFADVGIKPGNGSSYNNFIKKLKAEVIAGLSDGERAALGPLLTEAAAPVAQARPKKEYKFQKEWKMADFADVLSGALQGRNFASGRDAYLATQCASCHRFANEGGAIGPDLSGAGSKYSRRDLLESILEPSKVISDQYHNVTVTKKDGDDVTGRIVEETEAKLVLVPNPLEPTRLEVRKADIQGRVPSKLSPMPEGLVNVLTRDEVLDLLAYLESAGNKQHAAFK